MSTVLITGPTSGIGESLARLFAQEKHDLVLVARSREKLEALAAELSSAHGVKCDVIVKDLTSLTAPGEIFETLKGLGRTVDILVNNAGFTVFGRFDETALDAEIEMLQVNVVALTQMTKQFLRQLPKEARGRVLNLASTAAFQPGPLMAAYYASKAYVLSFSEAIASELEGSNVTVTALCPGPTRTGFQKRGQMEDSRLVKNRKIMDADTVARIGYRALMRGKPLVIPGFSNWIMAESVRFTPRWLVTRLVRFAQAPV